MSCCCVFANQNANFMNANIMLISFVYILYNFNKWFSLLLVLVEDADSTSMI